MNKSIRKSLYLCAAALMIGGVAAPTVSNSISASAHSRIAVSKYSHKKNIHKYHAKRIAHLRNIHKYHLRLEKKAKRNLAKHEKSLAHYNHLIHVHKHNRKMINNLTRAKNKLIKMIKADQHGIARQASLVESEEHKINLIKHGKKVTPSNIKKDRHGHKGNYGGKGYDYWFNLGKHGRHNSKRNMNHWENRAYNAGYNSIHHTPTSSASNNNMNQKELASAWSEIGYDVGNYYASVSNYPMDEATKHNISLYSMSSSMADMLAPSKYNKKSFIKGLMSGNKNLTTRLSNEAKEKWESESSSAAAESDTPEASYSAAAISSANAPVSSATSANY